ncbi:MAG: hypothetical protein HY000_25450 [Planctomycetes bacterium]|nr:hypothetical protein [Planctomycetota bacterium]
MQPDLEGTLLNAETYSWELASGTLRELAARSIPVVFCTSKTRAETGPLQDAMGVHDPFIVESGGALCLPDETIVLGAPYEEILDRFRQLKQLTGGAVLGFSDLTNEELAREAGLTVGQAALARRREYEEPF